jgi:hypothetical protein
MNTLDAKHILVRYRPGSIDLDDPQIVGALELARHDAELQEWLTHHNRFQTAMRRKFREIPIPAHLKESILSQPKIVQPTPWWLDRGWFRAAASVALLIGICYGFVRLFNAPPPSDNFDNYRSRMVRSAIREYRMDVRTEDLNTVRSLMQSKGAPADFAVPRGLSQLKLTGGGVLQWRNHPVAMVCFNRGDHQMLFLFVMNRASVKDAPATSTPEVGKVSKLVSASWSEGDKTYLLAGPEEADFLQKYF